MVHLPTLTVTPLSYDPKTMKTLTSNNSVREGLTGGQLIDFFLFESTVEFKNEVKNCKKL